MIKQKRVYIIKWTLLIMLLLFISVLIYSFILYNGAETVKNLGKQESKNKIYLNTDIVSIENIEQFNGDQPYHIIYGVDKDNQGLIAIVPFRSAEDKIKVIKEFDIVNKDIIYQEWQEDCGRCEMIKVVPGVVDKQIVWELTYKDELDRYIFEYLSIYSGEQYEKMILTERFN